MTDKILKSLGAESFCTNIGISEVFGGLGTDDWSGATLLAWILLQCWIYFRLTTTTQKIHCFAQSGHKALDEGSSGRRNGGTEQKAAIATKQIPETGGLVVVTTTTTCNKYSAD